MRRLGRAVLRARWARRSAALSLALGLLAGNGAMVATTVSAASYGPGGTHLLGGLLGLGSQPQANLTQALDELHVTLPQAVCQVAPVLCAPGTKVFEIPTGVVTLGSPPPHAAAPKPHPHVVIPPATGCILGLIGCGHSSPTPRPTTAPTAKPTSIVGSTSTSTTTTTTTTTTTPKATPAPSTCILGLLGNCPSGGSVSATCTTSASGTCQATPAPAPADNSLCVLSCNLLSLGGDCVASLLQTCVLPAQPSSPPSQGSGSGGSSSGACVAGLLCLLGSQCTALLANTCLVGALPGIGTILGSGGSNPQPTGGTGNGGSTSTAPGGSSPHSGSPTGSTTTTGIYSGLIPTGASQNVSGNSGSGNITTNQQPHQDESVGLVSGLSFGHGLILWPLFGLLDLAALAGLVVVVRRRWSATTS